jgi:hypothetical protein
MINYFAWINKYLSQVRVKYPNKDRNHQFNKD